MRSPRPMPLDAGAHGFQDGARSMASMKASSLPAVAGQLDGVGLSVTSMMRPRKMSAMRFISSRSLPTARTLTSISSRSM
jgi:hypothetical protein